jgi:hypothetical protein
VKVLVKLSSKLATWRDRNVMVVVRSNPAPKGRFELAGLKHVGPIRLKNLPRTALLNEECCQTHRLVAN